MFHSQKTEVGLFKILNRECLCSNFARHLFCRSTNMFLKLCLHLHTSHHSARGSSSSPLKGRDRKKPFFNSQHWWTGYIFVLYRRKTTHLVSQCCHHLNRNLFASCVSVGLAVSLSLSLCVNVYILLYMCGRTKWVN